MLMYTFTCVNIFARVCKTHNTIPIPNTYQSVYTVIHRNGEIEMI